MKQPLRHPVPTVAILLQPAPQSRRHRRLGVMLAAGLFAAIVAPAADEPKPGPAEKTPSAKTPEIGAPAVPVKPQPASTRRMVERLAGLGRDTDPLAIPFFADRAVALFRGKIAEA